MRRARRSSYRHTAARAPMSTRYELVEGHDSNGLKPLPTSWIRSVATTPGYSQGDFDTAADLMAIVQRNLDQGYATRPSRHSVDSAVPEVWTAALKCINDLRGHTAHWGSLPGAVPGLEETPTTVVVLQDGWQELTSGLSDQMSGLSCCMARKPARQMGGGDSWAI